MRDTRTKAKTSDSCVTNYRPANDPHESKGGEIRCKILQRVAQHCFVVSFGSMFRIFHLARLRKVESGSTLRVVKGIFVTRDRPFFFP